MNTCYRFNPFKVLYFDTKSFLILILSVQLAVWGFVGIEILGLDIPIIREVISFLYLSFVPGILILRLLKIKDLSNSEIILYCIGLSIISLIFIGLLANLIFPLIGIYNPISLIPLVISLSLFVFLLSALCFKYEFNMDSDYQSVGYCLDSNIFDVLNFKTLFIAFLPIMAIFGVFLMNYNIDNRLNLCLLVIISLLPLFVSQNILPRSYYPFIVLMVSISLLFDKSLITSYICGSDIFGEYNAANHVLMNNQWLFDTPGVLNGMLSITILAPVYSIIMNLNLMWVFKIIYPLFFSLLPLGIYVYASRQFNETLAFFAAILVAYTSSFYGIMLEAARQQIAEIFLILIVLLMFQNFERKKKMFLLVIFSLGLIVSHYGISYIFLILLMFSMVFLAVDIKFGLLTQIGNISFISCLMLYFSDKNTFEFSHQARDNFSYLYYFLFFVISLITWYIFIASSTIFNNFVSLFDIIVNSISLEIDASSIEGLNSIVSQLSTSRELTKYIYLIIQSLISFGIFFAIFNYKSHRLNKLYLYLSVSFYVLLVASLIVPHSSASMTTSRVYHTALIFLSPYALLGIFGLISLIIHCFSKQNFPKYHSVPYLVASVLFAFLLIFDSGFVCELIKDEPPNSYSLNESVIWPSNFIDQEFIEIRWFCANKDDSRRILLDPYLNPLYGVTVGDSNYTKIDANRDKASIGSYALLGRVMVVRDKIVRVYFDENALVHADEQSYRESVFFKKVTENMCEIYNSGKTKIMTL